MLHLNQFNNLHDLLNINFVAFCLVFIVVVDLLGLMRCEPHFNYITAASYPVSPGSITSNNLFPASNWPLPYSEHRQRAFFGTKNVTAGDQIHDLQTHSPTLQQMSYLISFVEYF